MIGIILLWAKILATFIIFVVALVLICFLILALLYLGVVLALKGMDHRSRRRRE